MENQRATPPPTERRRERSRDTSNQEGPAYVGVSRTAIAKENDFKENNGPAVSMTVVGENVTFTQHFNF